MAKYSPSEFESKWVEKWEKTKVYETKDSNSKDKYYCLDMFPYPSGSGLHVGHPHGYLGTDVISRYMRMKGKTVLHPMGFDAFGLPAENFAIKTGTPPKETTDKSIAMFKSQIRNMGLSYDWSRELATHRPEYYKWTQWLFLLFYKHGLAYKKSAPVNWCPKDQTVLANEQVINGKCERCDTEVVQKNMEQWFFKITDYAQRLLDGLNTIDWPESTKLGQINWIGRSEGTEVKFQVKDSEKNLSHLIVFTTRVDTIFGATFMVIAPEHPMVNEAKSSIKNYSEVEKYINQTKKETELDRQINKDKTGVKLEGVKAVNPFNNEEIPIFVADYVLMTYGTGAIMAVPAHDERDGAFAKKFGIETREVIKPENSEESVKLFTEYGVLINSGDYTGLTSKVAAKKMQEWLKEKGLGEAKVTYKLRDWLLSRQRYWGCPIPIVYDPEGNAHPIDEADLPLLLPTDVDFKPTGESPIASSEEFKKRAEEKYGKGWRYEVDTMDTFVDSSWYFYRFTDVNNNNEFASKESLKNWMPVDLYVGGAEHTVLHLMYSRFFNMVLFDLGYVDFQEPFQKLRHQGTILAEDGRKMSKRWGNVINPDDEINKYGADTLRVYEMFMGPFPEAKPWNTKGEVGVYRFITKVWELKDKINDSKNIEQEKLISRLIKSIDDDIERLSFNTAVAKFMQFINTVSKEESISKVVWEKFLLVLAPFAPFITEELWSQLGNEYSIHQQKWPEFDEKFLQDDTVKIAVQVNGKVRETIEVELDSDEKTVLAKALETEKVKKYVTSNPKKVIYVKNRIMNLIV